MRRFMVVAACFTLIAGALSAKKMNKEEKRLENCGLVMQEILNVPDDIPSDLVDKAECVIVIPSVKKLALGVGGAYGRGAMVCRTGEKFRGPWGAPAMYALEGASVGFQIGGEATDLVLLVMNDRGMESILSSKVKLGADASIAGGPKGRTASAATDAWMQAEILSYSRARGAFAGVSLEGSTIRPDDDANADVYGHPMRAKDIVRGQHVEVPEAGRTLVSALQKVAPHNESERAEKP
jgi:SH3 domain-containing YSC84-like protein 1